MEGGERGMGIMTDDEAQSCRWCESHVLGEVVVRSIDDFGGGCNVEDDVEDD